jgi:2-C-methyl-D-erythritol 4-phosphate cytidylyltransferase
MKNRQGKAPSCSAVIAAAGISQRNDGVDKLLINVCGAPVIAHAIAAFQDHGLISEIIVVTREDRIEYISELCIQRGFSKVTGVIVGGATRLESVLNGVLAVSEKSRLIAIHDGARPCIGASVIENAVMAAAKHHAAAPGIQVSSTIKRVSEGIVLETVERESLYNIQTPQVFTAEIIKVALTNVFNKSLPVTDDCMAVELLGIPVHITEGSADNIKLTTQEDFIFADAILKSRVQGV